MLMGANMSKMGKFRVQGKTDSRALDRVGEQDTEGLPLATWMECMDTLTHT